MALGFQRKKDVKSINIKATNWHPNLVSQLFLSCGNCMITNTVAIQSLQTKWFEKGLEFKV